MTTDMTTDTDMTKSLCAIQYDLMQSYDISPDRGTWPITAKYYYDDTSVYTGTSGHYIKIGRDVLARHAHYGPGGGPRTEPDGSTHEGKPVVDLVRANFPRVLEFIVTCCVN